MTCCEWVLTFRDNFGLSRCPLAAAQELFKLWVRSAAVEGSALPVPRPAPPAKRGSSAESPSPAAQSIPPSEPGLCILSHLGSPIEQGQPQHRWLCWCSTTLLRKLIAGLKQGSSTHCRADQAIPTWKRWAVHMWTVRHGMVWFVLNCFSRDSWLVSSAKYFWGEGFL